MKKLFISLLLVTCLSSIFAQEKHPYIYGVNNASMDFKLRGLPAVGIRVKYLVIKERTIFLSGSDPDLRVLDTSFTPDEIVETVADKGFNRPEDAYLTVRDIPCGVYAVGHMYQADAKKNLWSGRAYNRHFTNNSLYIHIDATDHE